VLADSRRSDGKHRQIYELDIPVLYDVNAAGRETGVRRLTYSDGQPVPPGAPYPGYLPNGSANDYNPSVSPDGTKIVFVSDREGAPQLYLMTADGQSPNRLSNSGCVDQVPSWTPNGRSLYWESQCSGQKFKIMTADLSYGEDSSFGTSATLVNIRELTAQDQGDNRFPRVSPDGRKVAFTSYRDGNAEIYMMNPDGGLQTRLTSSAGEDEAASWSPNGQQLIFASSRDGDYELYLMNADGSGQARLTNQPSNERWVLWAQ
jgi:Tol biopolymer transport system component